MAVLTGHGAARDVEAVVLTALGCHRLSGEWLSCPLEMALEAVAIQDGWVSQGLAEADGGRQLLAVREIGRKRVDVERAAGLNPR